MKSFQAPEQLRKQEDLAEGLRTLHETWGDPEYSWVVGGSTSLLVQGVELAEPPRDIDVYADMEMAKKLHLKPPGRMTDVQLQDRNGIYSSLLSHYQVHRFSVELVGDFQVLPPDASYRMEVEHVLIPYAPCLLLDEARIYLTPLSHELIFNIFRGREDRYEPIAATMKSDLQAHRPVLDLIQRRNSMTVKQCKLLESLLS
ncbi:hypothetical protein Q5741_01500 [Paenibacillus sp. JX-17]|uniref:Nucleotidyl transferase AbiEii/AbiGii toxin family protein n=1 Tax=Paenibacillus lacisoli TaxID=3064525 RepID=A0ABT9C771_9BACL|nr:hypothetical protein [Paenibacillus sp. JX-17]MDO7905086.1 hypothetical protein [Paenibacillus sp. JX-17]